MNPTTPMFVGERLTEAREVRQFTMAMLAERIDVSRQIVSEYEKGAKKPSADVLARLAGTLAMPMSFFLKSFPPEVTTGPVFFRSMAAATLQARQRARRRCQWLQRVVEYLRQFVAFRAASFPDLQPPSDPRHLREEDVAHAAAAARQYWKLGDDPIPNLVGLLESAGAFVVRQELWADKLDSLSRWDADSPQPYFVLGTDKASAVRSRFDAAHELGHILLHRRVSEPLHNGPAVFSLMEDQAHQFAGAFLLPERAFVDEFLMHLGNINAFIPLKSRWMVSIQAMFMRAKGLNLISPERLQNLWRSLARQGWRLREPLDDELSPESPCLLRKSLDLVLGKGIIDGRTLELHLGLKASDVASVCGLPSDYFEKVTQPLELKPGTSESDGPDRIIRFPTPNS